MSGAEQFHLDVDVDSLRAAQNGLQTLAEHLATVATVTTRVPADVGDGWTGPAATAMKAELVGLGTQTSRFAPKFHGAAMALKTFADAAEIFQTQTLPDYIRRWDRAEADATAAYDKADSAYDDEVRAATALSDPEASAQARATASSVRGGARGQVAMGQRYTMSAMASQFSGLKEELEQAAKAAGDAMAGLTVVAVPDSVAKDFIGHHGGGQTIGWCNADGSMFPPDLGTDGALPGMTLVRDLHDMADGEQAAREFNETFQTGPQSEAELDDYLKTLNGDSAAFRQAFLAGMDTTLLPFIQRVAREGVEADTGMKYGEVITAIAAMMAKASNATTQGDYPVPAGFYDDLRDQYKNTVPPEEGYLLLAEVVQAGQAEQDTWDPALLTDITKDTIAFERDLHETDPTFFWGDVFGSGNGVLPTQAGRDLTGTVPGRIDALGMLLDAVGHNADASQDVLRGTDGNADLDLLHYLYDGRRGVGGDMYQWGYVFGNVLEEASTHHRGSGGIGSRDYVSAQIAADLVNYAGEKPEERLSPGMEQNVVDILTVHMDAVNMFAENRGFNKPMLPDDLVSIGRPGEALPWTRVTHANLDSGRLNSLMSTVFRNDYWTAKVEADAHSGKNPHPLLSQFTLAQQATWQQDVTYAAGHLGDHPGLLEGLAAKHGWSSNATIQAYTSGITHEGGAEDASRDDARAATDFVLGFGLDKLAEKVPGGPGLGIPKLIAGEALDSLKTAAIDMWLPEGHDGEKAAGMGAEMKDQNTSTGAMAYLKWLDQPGQGPTEASSYDSYATTHAGHLEFMTQAPDGHWHIKDPGQLYLNKDTSGGKQAWDDFKFYYDNAGSFWLRDTDIWESFNTGVTDNDAALAAEAKRVEEASS